MIEIKDKKDCCGCHACMSVCAHRAITMQVDGEGFLYPVVNMDSCSDCGLCEQVCPVNHQTSRSQPLKVYASKSRDEEVRHQSSSGGIFTLLAEAVIRDGGVVFGAKFDEEWNVVHASTETLDGLTAFRGSKYVQSAIGDAYMKVKEFLQQGRKVLFTGTPCQIAGLKKCLRKDYDNLLTVDVVCHGVPSPLVWQKYLSDTRKELCEKHGAEEDVSSSAMITDISFRDKTHGWSKYGFRLRYSSSAVKEGSLLQPFSENVFMNCFLSYLSLRPSCHSCPSKGGKSGSDISIADFWGIEKYNAKFTDNKGASAVLVHTDKGKCLFGKIDAIKEEQSFEQFRREVTTYYRSVEAHPKRSEFFERLNKAPLKELVSEYVPKKKPVRKSLLKKIAKQIMPNDFRILWDKPGQTCNRLWSYLDTIGWSIRTQQNTYVLFWDKDIKHFDRLRNNPYIKFPLYNKTLIKWLGDARYQKLLTWAFGNRFLNRFYARTTSKKFVYSWKQRSSKEYFPYVMDEIREVYAPNQHIIDEVKPVMAHYRSEGYFIIGVHIRRGDYKTFEGGRYYFELEEYKRHMQALCEVYKDRKVCFAISTNEKIDAMAFEGLEICKTTNATAIHDLYMLMQCDRIIGPLSTFSRWASFYGEVPLCFISRGDVIESDEAFSVIKDFYHFANGTEIINLTDKYARI